MAPLQLATCSFGKILTNAKQAIETKVVDGMYIWWHCPDCGSWHLLPPEHNQEFHMLPRSQTSQGAVGVCGKHQ
jgi:hypothetical protein